MDRSGLQARPPGARGATETGRQGDDRTSAEASRPPEIAECEGIDQPADSPSDPGALEGQRSGVADAHGGNSDRDIAECAQESQLRENAVTYKNKNSSSSKGDKY